ncbi:Non-heme chloroperoxidase [Slackia heliotrinireducens]|uniref:Predicted hydrolase or acyltransferase of alpha/beta superfamily n=1 Tax=Slackia heliotrinireducens (strain ATCC 29202 / DSM 20476 / NCTC 11029 / RHS 1) TaxID=471855 RepID=C7N2V6_SLAHD|nr:alpha/beta hydrolase [Slackia heliotrinireducens]ACV21477.1 predicted hydrolase or acyltransferase of alpha/beta superfamily [Slackia heliotrinireducens DSM 20476]VEG98916.1 Non-heme chloroperoxidase [Slackia heliotrinireducens]
MPYITTQDGTKLYYEDRPAKDQANASAEDLLIIHGLGSSHYDLAQFIDDLNETHRVVFYDQRNHADSDRAQLHLNVKTLGQDLNDVIEQLDLRDINAFGHSMGAAAIFSYVNQYGTERLSSIGIADMSPYLSNADWKGGIRQGTWTDKDFMGDMDRLFDDAAWGAWHIAKTLMNPKLQGMPADQEAAAIEGMRPNADPLGFPALWFSLFYTDQRPALAKIDVPVLYLMPELPLYSHVNVDFIASQVKAGFTLEENFPGTTHLILSEAPHETAAAVERFLAATK